MRAESLCPPHEVPAAAPVEDALPDRLPVEEPEARRPLEVDEHSTLGMVELLLKDPQRMDRINREEARQQELIPRFLAIALGSYLLFSTAMLLILKFGRETKGRDLRELELRPFRAR